MDIKIFPSTIGGSVTAPPSKSLTHRAIITAVLARENSILRNVLLSEDTLKTIEACRAFGVEIIKKGNDLKIKGSEGKLTAPGKPINLGNSGTSMRIIAGLAAIAKGTTVLTGEKRLCQRPIADLINALKILGIKAESLNNGCPPVKITGGRLKGGPVKIAGNVSSQYITSLLLISPFSEKPLTIKVPGELKSKPYVLLTMDVMKSFGINVANNNFLEFNISNTKIYKGRSYKIEGDFSSASYFFAAAAIANKKITVKNLNPKSSQGDKFFLEILKKMGCEVAEKENEITVKGPKKLIPVNIDMGNYPDIVPTLCAVCAFAKGQTKIANISHIKDKESDRIKAPANELLKMGITAIIDNSSIVIDGGKPKGAEINTYNDHRMAMSFSILAAFAKGQSIIKNADVVSKSYPDFFDDLKKIGVRIERI